MSEKLPLERSPEGDLSATCVSGGEGSGRTRRWVSRASGVAAAALALAALAVATDNPTIDHTSRGSDYPCASPWDTVLLDADNVPGGELPPDAERIAARCRTAGEHRFDVGLTFVGGAVVLLLAGWWTRRPSGGS